MFTATFYKTTRKVSFRHRQIINSDLVLVHAARQKTTLNKPIVVEFSTNSNSYAICHIFIVIVVRCYASATCYHAACLSVRVCLSHSQVQCRSSYLRLSVYLLCSYVNISFYTAKCPSVFLLHVCIYQSIHLSVRPSVCPYVTRRYSVDSRHHSTYPQFFYRTTHMHSADYAVATCLSDHSSLCLSDSPSVCHTTGLPPCTGRKNTDIYGINCPYIMFTAMCPYVCLPILYVPFVHFNLLNCVVTHVSLIARPPSCLFVFCVQQRIFLLYYRLSPFLHHHFYHKVGLSLFLSSVQICVHTVMRPSHSRTILSRRRLMVGAVVQLVEYRTRNQEATHTQSTASNLEQATVCSSQLNLQPSAGWEMSSYGVKTQCD